jgi:hypothetical protein
MVTKGRHQSHETKTTFKCWVKSNPFEVSGKEKKGKKEKDTDNTHLHSVLNPSGRRHDQGLGTGRRECLVTGC